MKKDPGWLMPSSGSNEKYNLAETKDTARLPNPCIKLLMQVEGGTGGMFYSHNGKDTKGQSNARFIFKRKLRK